METNPITKIRVILTGATGMVGEGVLNECLQHPRVEKVLIINRKSSGIAHPKLKEIIHANFFDITPIQNELSDYDSCFFCLGVSSVGMKENEFYHLTHELTMHVAQTLSTVSPGMTFCYISGRGTDSAEKGMMWARVKGKTENDLMQLPFRQVYNFRPGVLQPTKGLKNTLVYYKLFGWMMPLIKAMAPRSICSLKELGIAMINVASIGYENNILEVNDILALSKK